MSTLFVTTYKKFCMRVPIVLFTLAMAGTQPGADALVWRHQTQCPYCKLDVVQDTKQQDNEVAIRYGRKRIEYRCLLCAMAEAKTEYRDDLTILAPSEIKGRPVLITRHNGQWSVLPQTTVFIDQTVEHPNCYMGHRAFTSRAAFADYVKKNASLHGLHGAKPRTLAQLVAAAAP